MIRLPTNQKVTFPALRRRRVSNQLAAFAAIMLFASTQVASPERSDTRDAGASANPAVRSVERNERADSGKAQTEKPADAVAAQVVSSERRKDKSLDLSLFLFRR